MLRISILAALFFTFCAPAVGQNDWWKMPGTQKANPPTQQILPPNQKSTALVFKAVKWSFPGPDVNYVTIEDRIYYILAPEVFGTRGSFKNGLETAVIVFSPRLTALAQLMHIQEPATVPDVDRFLASMAVLKAVETPSEFTNRFLGSAPVDGLLVHFFRTYSGANVGAYVDTDRRKVLIMQAPTEP